MKIGLVDTHCHLTDRAFNNDRGEVIERAREAGVTNIVAVGGGGPIEHSEAAAELALRYPFLRATAGIHPHDARNYDDRAEARIEALLERPEVVAAGETGLDYYYDNSPRDVQREVLARHLALAKRHDVPVVLHCRDAESDLREVIEAERPDGLTGVVHCFTGTYEDASWYLDHGLLVSFTGILTYKRSDDLRAVAGRLPLESVMVETDAPYLTPEPRKPRRNEPAFVTRVADTLAEVHKTSREHVIEATGTNAERLFFS